MSSWPSSQTLEEAGKVLQGQTLYLIWPNCNLQLKMFYNAAPGLIFPSAFSFQKWSIRGVAVSRVVTNLTLKD